MNSHAAGAWSGIQHPTTRRWMSQNLCGNLGPLLFWTKIQIPAQFRHAMKKRNYERFSFFLVILFFFYRAYSVHKC